MHCVISLFILVAALGVSSLAQESTTQLLDLTKPAPKEQQETGLPGMSVGGIGGQHLPSTYRLPLRIELVSIDPQPVKLFGDKFIVEVRLRNASAVAFFLPASQNSVEVLRHEGRGRRNFDFDLVFANPKTGQQILSVTAIAAGSDTVNGSLLRIPPGGEVRVLFTADLGPVAAAFGHDLDKIEIRAGASEITFEDRRYFVERKSEEIISENVITITLETRN
jgi:hypothetical protein